MPILRNDGAGTKSVRGKDGMTNILEPGQTVETYYFSADPEITVVNNEPLISHAMGLVELDFTQDIPAEHASDVPGFSGAKVDIDLAADAVYLQIESGSVTVYRQHPDQDPELKDWTESMPMVPITAKGTMTKLYVSGTGQVKIMQWRELL